MAYDQGRGLLKAIEMECDGAKVSGEPQPGKTYEFRMKKGVTYHGAPPAALKALRKAFPESTFMWATDPKE